MKGKFSFKKRKEENYMKKLAIVMAMVILLGCTVVFPF